MKAQIRQSLIRAHFIMGCERIPFSCLAFFTGILLINLNPISIILGIVIWVFGIATLRKYGKRDPYFFEKYRKSLKYSSYYAPFKREERC